MFAGTSRPIDGDAGAIEKATPMQIEFVLSDYLVSVGAAMFLCVALSELGNARHIGLPKSALGSLFLLVIGACFGSLALPGTEGPLASLRAFLNLSEIVSIPGLSLLLICMVVAYLATTLNPGEGDVPTRIVCAVGAVTAIALCAYLLYHTVHLGAMSKRGTLLYSIAFVTNAITTGYVLFSLSCQLDANAKEPTSFERRLAVIVCALQSLAFAAFTASFILQLSQGIVVMPDASTAATVTACWIAFFVFGLVGTVLCGIWTARAKGGGDGAKRQRRSLALLLAASVVAGCMLQCIMQLSSTWMI